ncbi:hypothetical protein WMY93_030507 [Mugilogobius chulae]|uniref:Cadherin domain-containing protein n=1 Tax=Mugilogobius chulae TaxID=88201 RepID=A0AAW0MJP1_9GOBI
MGRALTLLLLVASTALACEEPEHSRVKRDEVLIRTKRRWVLSTIEVAENDKGPFPKEISQMHNDQMDKGKKHLFRISGSGVTEPPLGVFSIDEETGVVFAHKTIDREKNKLFHIKFDILNKEDLKPMDKELSFDVEIKDENDNPPRFLEAIKKERIKESLTDDYLPVQLHATDPDQPNSPNSTIKFKMVSQKPQEPKMELEQIDDRTAHLKFTGCFDYDTAKIYQVIAIAYDEGTPSLTSTATITLLVTDSNTHRPTFKEPQYYTEVQEMAVANNVLRVAVEDKDSPNTPGWIAKYSFVSGNEDGNYQIVTDKTTNEGIFSVIKGKDFERTTLTNITIKVENEEEFYHCKYKPGPIPQYSTANITIKVMITNVHQKEEDPPGKVLFIPKVTDVDSDVSKIRFKLLKDPAEWMTIDPKTGTVTTAKKMDRESEHVKDNVYQILVGAIDDGTPPATGTATVNIHLKDINDHKPTLVNNSLTYCTNMYEVPIEVQDLDGDPYSGPFFFAFDDSDPKLKEYWKLEPVLVLLLIFVCRCGKSFQKLPNILTDEGNQTLIRYNQEGGSSECKTEPSMFLPTMTTTITNNITATDGQKTLVPLITYTTEENEIYNRYKSNFDEEAMGMHPGGMRGNGMYNYNTWSRSGTYMGTSQYNRYSLQVNQHISEHIHRKLQMLSAGQGGQGAVAEEVGYKPYEYKYEGQGSRSQSLDQLSLGNLDDLQFLNDLGPKFKTLGRICKQGMEEKNIHL